jgi:uncharacterized protein YndB with AHSA1/START domain
MKDTEAGGDTLRLERLIASPPEVLFALWTEPDHLLKWWGPEECETLVHTLDLRAGGHWRIVLRRPNDSALAISGVYRVVEPPRRLVFTWAWEDERGTRGHETEVAVHFEAAPGGTRLILRHGHFENRQRRDGHDAGWSASFDRLAGIAG